MLIHAAARPIQTRFMPQTDDLTLGGRIRGLRKSYGLSQRSLAEKIGISQSAVSQIEKGHTESLHGDTLAGLCKALRTTPEMLLSGYKSSDELEQAMFEAELVSICRELPPAGRKALRAAARGLLAEYGKPSATDPRAKDRRTPQSA